VTLFLLATLLSTAEVPALRTACCLRRALANPDAAAAAFAAHAPDGHRDRMAVRTEAPLAAPVAAFGITPQRRRCGEYLPPALAPRAPLATLRSERAPPCSLA
jgi:hypothetical protein